MSNNNLLNSSQEGCNMDDLSSQEEIKEEEIYRSVRSALYQDPENNFQDHILNQKPDQNLNDNEKTMINTNQQKEIDQNFRTPISNYEFDHQPNQNLPTYTYTIQEEVQYTSVSNSQPGQLQEVNERAEDDEDNRNIRSNNYNMVSRLQQIEQRIESGIKPSLAGNQKLQPIVHRHNRAQTTEQYKLKQFTPKSFEPINRFDYQQIPKFKQGQQQKPSVFNEYVRAQQNNLFCQNLEVLDEQIVQIVNDSELIPQSHNQSTIKGTLIQNIEKIPASHLNKLKPKDPTLSSILKRDHNKSENGYDFSSILPDAQQNQRLHSIKTISNQSGQQQNYSISDNISLIKAFNEYEVKMQKILMPSFVNNKEENEESEKETKKKAQYTKCTSSLNERTPVKQQFKSFTKEDLENDIQQFVGMSPEQIGIVTKKVIENAEVGQVIQLPDCHIKVPDLQILRPISIKGKPGTILEITHGSIIVDFEQEQKYKDVLIICECHIVFSDRADLIVIKEELDKEDISTSQFYSNKYETLSRNDNKLNIPKSFSPAQIAQLDISPLLAMESKNTNDHKEKRTSLTNALSNYEQANNGLYPLFEIKNSTYVEIRDCCLMSRNKYTVMDAAFVMNEKDLQNSHYKSILSVKSCNIQNFSFGFFSGSNSIISIELSYITDCRQSAVFIINPKILKISGTILDNIEAKGIEVYFKQSQFDKQQSIGSPKEAIKKVFIEDNRISNCKEQGIILHGQSIKGHFMEQINVLVKLSKNRVYNNRSGGIYMKKLNLLSFEMFNCEIVSNGNYNIMLSKIKTQLAENFMIQKTRISDSTDVGIVVKDCTSLTISECEILKNKATGLQIADTGAAKFGAFKKYQQQQTLLGSYQQRVPNSNFEVLPITPGKTFGGELLQIQESIGADEERNINNLRISNNQGIIGTSTIMSGNKFENTSNHYLTTLQPIVQPQLSTQLHNGQTSTRLQFEKQGILQSGRSHDNNHIGLIRVIKSKIQENKENGMSLEDIYQKTVEVIKCKIKDNYLNGISIAQELETEEEINMNMQMMTQQNNQNMPQSSNNNEIQYQSSNEISEQGQKPLIIRKDIIMNSKILIVNCEIFLNKLNGIQMGYTRTIIKDSLIVDNMQYAIKLLTYNTKLLLRIGEADTTDSTNKERLIIKGRIGGDWGEIANPLKELKLKNFTEFSDLSRMLDDIKQIDAVQKTDIIKDAIQPSNNNSKKSFLKCFSKQERKRIEQIGDYLIIKENYYSNSARMRQDNTIKQSKSTSNGLFKCCITPTHKKQIIIDESNARKSGCLIF